MRLVFIATGGIALPALTTLIEQGPRPLVVVTQPDKPVGRHQVLAASPIKTAAMAAGIPVWQPEVIGSVAAELAALQPDVIVVMAYGQMLRDDILSLPRQAIINLHASLLPRHRGAACIQAAIDAGDASTGITAMHMTRRLDAGDLILAKSLPIDSNETGGSMHDKLADLAAVVLHESLQQITAGTAQRQPQDESFATYVPRLMRDDGRLDWNQSADVLERRIRAYDPWPGTFTIIPGPSAKPLRLKIFPPTRVVAHATLQPGDLSVVEGKSLWVGCGEGTALELTRVQPDGSRVMSAQDMLRGRTLPTSFVV